MSELTAHVDLPLHVSASAVARQAAHITFAAWGFTDQDWVDDAMLIVTELVSNAVRHGGGCLTLELSANEQQVTVAAVDGSAVVPRRRDEHGQPDVEGGRGLTIIEALCQHWGVDNHHGGKRVWVQLMPYPLPPNPDGSGDSPLVG